MSNIIETIKSLPDLAALKPATQEQVNNAENELGVKFSKEYKEYLMTFGAIMAKGIELTGISEADYINVVKVTREEWELNSKVPRDMYVVENIYIDGLISWQTSDGAIYRSTPDNEPEKIADTLNDYILNVRQN